MARTLNKRPGYDISRLRRFAQKHLGVKWLGSMEAESANVFRDPTLDVLDRYYDNTQYDDLMPWDEAMGAENYVEVRKRQPRIIYNIPKTLVDRVTSKIIGSSVFPTFIVEDQDDDTMFFRTVQKAVSFRKAMIEPVRNTLKSGACFVRFFLKDGQMKIEHAASKYCYPVFDEMGQLDSIEIKYVYEDTSDIDANNKCKKKWYRLQLTKTTDTLFDNPEYRAGSAPKFQVVATAAHNLGFVQGEWFVTHDDKFNHDGYSLYKDILDFCDEFNYSLSQSSQASQYSQEPQLAINKMDEDEIDTLVRSSEKAWNLGREGEAKYIETDMKGVQTVKDFRSELRTAMLDVVRIILHDPEKMTGNAQSGDALKQLNAPLVELVDELRTYFEALFTRLLIKISMTCLHYDAMGEETPVVVPPGYMPSSLDITVQWPNIFPPTLADIQVMANAANIFQQGGIVSRESLTRWVGNATPIIDNVEEELKRIATQEPLPSPFGTFGDDGGPPQ